MEPGDQIFANSLATKMRIICAKDYIVKVDEDYYYLSYSFNNDGVTAESLVSRLNEMCLEINMNFSDYRKR